MWMHSAAALVKYGSTVEVTAAINRGDVYLDNSLPVEGEFDAPSEKVAQRLALAPTTPLDKLSHAMYALHNKPPPRLVDGVMKR